MKERNIAISTLTITIALAACGGGDGGGTTGITYTGARNPVAITGGDYGNADEVVESSMQGASRSISTSAVVGVVTDAENDQAPSKPYSLLIPRALAKTVQNIQFEDGDFLPGVTKTETDTIDCDGGGNGSITLTGDDQTGVFSGHIQYHNCISIGVKISGTVTIRGIADLDQEELEQMTLSFNSLNVNDGDISVTMSGRLSIQYDYPTITMNSNHVAQNDTTGKQIMMENFETVVTEVSNDEFTAEMLGRFYNSEYGYVDITTPETLYYDNSSGMWPYSGKIRVVGDRSSALAICINSMQYTLQVDENNDGTYDSTTTENWGQ